MGTGSIESDGIASDGTEIDGNGIDLDALATTILARPSPHAVRIVGIDGPAGSGKTTLAARLSAALSASVVHVDDFLSWTDLDWWWPRFDAEILTPLSQGRDVRYQVRDWIRDEFGTSLRGWKKARATPVVIVEGVSTTRRAAVDRLVFTVWVEAGREDRLERGMSRDGEGHRELWTAWMAMEQAFFAEDGTRARADLRIDTSGEPGDRYRTF